MNDTIINKIKALGGNAEAVDIDKSFAENWKQIKFTHYLYDKDWDVYGIDQFYEANKELYQNQQEKFYENLLAHYFSAHDSAYGQYFVKDWMFIPFKEGSEDQEEFDDLIDEDYVQGVVGISKPEFLCILYSYGYPDHYFICTEDPDQSNPTVYSTDHEVYFGELDNKGNLDDFLDQFMTKDEFREVVKGYLEEKLGK
ncbi:hypothetical protein [Chryseobacterium sp. BIGb0232]|uniref:hypothetical protein n=1 Tax=Chryseobacterium sp. BIGb0232 TaxID=2940598 RepID=UPI000F4882F1|nr:hypothetical protein [Chryseobacterium sp. BIGb0232]MCS4305438.1 hypothetical protein [Chryseobacterium sp. BIGb0232]ROS07110.1 hypothetical protein EDF65_5039 [Chryseobacterium nakagawai]